MNDIVISCIIRFHKFKDIHLLSRAIQSLHAQVDVMVQPIVVLQDFNEKELDIVHKEVFNQWFFRGLPVPVILNLPNLNKVDLRAELLNQGIKEHLRLKNKFLAFLDYDDVLYSHAYITLLKPMKKLSVTVSFATVEVAKAIPLQDYEFIYDISRPFKGSNKLDLIKDNFCPIHSYLIDTENIPVKELYFRSDLTRLEDYEFLLRVAVKYPCSFSQLDKVIGMYVMRSDYSNSSLQGSFERDIEKKKAEWARNKKIIDSLRKSYQVNIFTSDL